jgi:hypothetical protein
MDHLAQGEYSVISKHVLEAMKNDRTAVIQKGSIHPKTFHYIPPNSQTPAQRKIIAEAYVWVEQVHDRNVAACNLRIALYEEEGIIGASGYL